MKKILISLCVLLISNIAHADLLPLDDALRATYTACVGIESELAELKKLAGIGTAVSGVGTGLGAGATVVGILKTAKDRQIESYEKLLQELREMQEKNAPEESTTTEQAEAFEQEFNAAYDTAVQDIEKYNAELEKLTKQSKSLGNWRTGLMAGAAVSNIAGVVVSTKGRKDNNLEVRISDCLKSLDDLNNSMMQARINGEDISEAQSIITACREYSTVDVKPISNRQIGAQVSSIVGATTGVAGTVTSAMANSDKVRNDNTDSGKKKEKNLNTASNVLAGTTTVASAAATVFNATQISAIKRVVSVAEKCEGVLK